MENMPCQHEMTRKALLTIRSVLCVRVPQVKQLGQRKVICPFIGKLISALIMCLNTTFSLFFRFHSLWARTPRRLRRGRILNRPFTRRFNLDHQDRLGTFPHQPRSSTGCRMFHPVPTCRQGARGFWPNSSPTSPHAGGLPTAGFDSCHRGQCSSPHVSCR